MNRIAALATLAAVLAVAGCTNSGEANNSDSPAPAPSASSTPAALGTRTVSVTGYDGLSIGTPIERSPGARQVSLWAVASDGAALVTSRPDITPKAIDGVYLPVGQLQIVGLDGDVQRIPGAERAVDDTAVSDRYVLWIERPGTVREGHVEIAGRETPGWVLRSYDRQTRKLHTLAQIEGGNRPGSPEFASPMIVEDRAVWSVRGQARDTSAVFSRAVAGSDQAREEVPAAKATASDGTRLWYSTHVPQAGTDPSRVRIVSRDLELGSETVAHELTPPAGEVLALSLAAAEGTVVWNAVNRAGSRLVISDGERIQGEIASGALAWRALSAAPGLIGYGHSPDPESSESGHGWLLDRERNIRIDLGVSCCPRVLLAGNHVIWDDGTAYRRATLTDPPSATADADHARALQIYTAVLQRLIIEDPGGKREFPFHRVWITDGPAALRGGVRVDADAVEAFSEALKADLRRALVDLPPLEFVSAAEALDDRLVRNESAVLTVGQINGSETRVEVAAALNCGKTCGRFETYILERRGDIWLITGTTGAGGVA